MADFLKKLKDVFTKSVPDTSDPKKVDSTDMAKLVKTGALVGVGAALSYVVTNIDPSHLGPYQPVIMLALTLALDFVNKLVKNNS